MLHGIVTRGSTPTQVFELPFDTQELADFLITYACNDEILVEKNSSQCMTENSCIIVELSQEDTLSFPANEIVEAQLKVLTKSGKVFISPSYNLGIGKVLNGRVMRL